MKQICIIVAMILILGMATPTQDKLDVIIANQRQIMDDVSHNRQMVDRIFYLMTARESLAAEQF